MCQSVSGWKPTATKSRILMHQQKLLLSSKRRLAVFESAPFTRSTLSMQADSLEEYFKRIDLPNKLTLSRVFVIPLFFIAFTLKKVN